MKTMVKVKGEAGSDKDFPQNVWNKQLSVSQ